MTDLAQFEITVVSDGASGPLPTVRVAGEVDLVTSVALRDELLGTVASSRGGVVVDLQGVQFIDAAGISALVAAANKARGQGGRLVVQNPSAAVERIFDIVDLDGALPIVRTPNAVPDGDSIADFFAELNQLGNRRDQLDVAESRTLIAHRLQQLRAASYTVDRISDLTGIGTSEVLTLLAELAVKGKGQGTRPAQESP